MTMSRLCESAIVYIPAHIHLQQRQQQRAVTAKDRI